MITYAFEFIISKTRKCRISDNHTNNLLVQASVIAEKPYFILQYTILRLPPTRHNGPNYHFVEYAR